MNVRWLMNARRSSNACLSASARSGGTSRRTVNQGRAASRRGAVLIRCSSPAVFISPSATLSRAWRASSSRSLRASGLPPRCCSSASRCALRKSPGVSSSSRDHHRFAHERRLNRLISPRAMKPVELAVTAPSVSGHTSGRRTVAVIACATQSKVGRAPLPEKVQSRGSSSSSPPAACARPRRRAE